MLVVMTFLGSIGLLYHFDPPGYVPDDDDLRLHGWMIVMYTLIAVPVGMLLAAMAFRVKSMRVLLARYEALPLEPQCRTGDRCFRHSLYLMSGLSLGAIGGIIVSQGSSVPLWNLLSGLGDYWQLMRLRRSSGLRIEGHEFLTAYIALQAAFASVMAFAAYAYWKMERSFGALVWFLCLALTVVLFATYSLVKAPVLYFLIGLLLARIMIVGRIRTRTLVAAGAAFVFLIGLLVVFFQGVLHGNGQSINASSILVAGLDAFWHRVVFGQLVCFYMCLDIFPDLHPHLWFSTTGRFIHDVLGLTYRPDYGIIVMSFFRPGMVQSGVAGHASTVFIGEAWANFGLLGVLVGPLWAGFVIQSLHIWLLKLRKTPLNVALYVQFTLWIPIATNLKGLYYPASLVQYLALIAVVFVLATLLRSARVRDMPDSRLRQPSSGCG